ncbi:HYC_CC_PP family protein [Maribacter polysaccharolyticus]|uniref:HYC_CC_PP family protein n=1 Tax=Maribacter polysaccharolyticus TaxID=3020831 RepID=UPI00237EFA77|nr:hypothetical protein [Maribacter polysaccharolyticus]MDE3741080.1 hypothetical protein [Maribacter polysaccharolyticus]
MKKFFTKILSISLTCAVLFTSTAFTADMHFCCNKLVDVAVFGKAKPCKDKIQKAEKYSKKCSFDQKDCCSNKSFVKQGNDNLKKVTFELGAENYVFLQAFLYTYVNLFDGFENKLVAFVNYNPPWIEKDILVLHETFLI